MKIFLSSSSVYIKEKFIHQIKEQFLCPAVRFVSLVEQFDTLKNLYQYNFLNPLDLFIVDCSDIDKLSSKNFEFLLNSNTKSYICFYFKDSSVRRNKIQNICEYEFISQISNKKEALQQLSILAQNNRLKIGFNQIKYLFDLCNNNFDLCVNEIKKLKIYYEDIEIFNYEIDLLVNDLRQSSFFDFYKILFSENQALKLKYINSYINSNQVIQLHNNIKSYVYLCYQVKLILQDNLDPNSIANKLKKNHYYISNICNNIRNVSVAKIIKLVDQLILIDLELLNSNVNIKYTLYKLFL